MYSFDIKLTHFCRLIDIFSNNECAEYTVIKMALLKYSEMSIVEIVVVAEEAVLYVLTDYICYWRALTDVQRENNMFKLKQYKTCI